MPYIRRFTKLAYQQYKQIFTIHVEFLIKILCQIYQGDATIFDVFCKKKKKAEGTRVRVSRLGEFLECC